MPTSATVTDVDTTIWGRVPRLQAVVNAFSNDNNSRQYQDIGYDGINSTDEQSFFDNFLQIYQNQLTPDAYQKLIKSFRFYINKT